MIPHCGISNCGVFMEFMYSITVYKCGVYNIPEELQMITTFSTYYGTDLVFRVETRHIYIGGSIIIRVTKNWVLTD